MAINQGILSLVDFSAIEIAFVLLADHSGKRRSFPMVFDFRALLLYLLRVRWGGFDGFFYFILANRDDR